MTTIDICDYCYLDTDVLVSMWASLLKRPEDEVATLRKSFTSPTKFVHHVYNVYHDGDGYASPYTGAIQASISAMMKSTVVEDSIFECRRCKSKKTTNNERFLRSGDEAGIIFVHCAHCGYMYKM